jgi:uncharacterized protein (TIGR02001 family)
MFRRFAALLLLSSAFPAFAQEAAPKPEDKPAPTLTLVGEVALVSDYRFRGLTYTDFNPAVQASATLIHKSGAYANVWASNLADTPLYGELELDFAGGWMGTVTKGGTLDVGAGYYTYPDGDPKAGKANFGELYARYAQAVGPVTGTLGVGYVPKQASMGDRDNLYVSGDVRLDVPKTPLTLNAHIGRTDGALGPVAYDDWSFGATVALGHARLGLTYVDTDIAGFRPGRAGLVGTAKIVF